MTFRFIALFCVFTSVSTFEPVSALKFGDRIGKLKRNFKVSTPPSSTTTTRQHADDYEDSKNEIHRSDNYFLRDDHENKNFFVLKNSEEKKIIQDPVDNNSTQVLNKTFNVQSPSSSLVQARLEMLTDFFDVPPLPLSSVYSTASRPTSFSKTGVVLAAKNYIYPTNSTFRQPFYPQNELKGLRRDSWSIPILSTAILSMSAMVSFEIFVLLKTRRTSPNRRHLFLGQMLLLGLFTCAGMSALSAARPTMISCATIRFGTGVSFAIVFASLLVKCIFLISLNGGVYLPAIYQGLLLLFAVLIQITVNIQWLLNSPAGVNSQTNRLIFTAENLNSMRENFVCKTSFFELRVSLIYVDFLIITIAILAIKSRNIRDNYREANYIGLAIALVIPIWLGFTLFGLAVNERHKEDACLAVGLLSIPTIIFVIMFLPKGRQLAAMGREDMYMEERDERSFTSSRAGSGYSPSFFHFKPIKYGVMNGKNSGSKQQQAVGTIGDDIALSYYFPLHQNYTQKTPIYYYLHNPPNYAGLFLADDYTTLEQTQHSSNPNVYFQRSNIQQNPGMIY